MFNQQTDTCNIEPEGSGRKSLNVGDRGRQGVLLLTVSGQRHVRLVGVDRMLPIPAGQTEVRETRSLPENDPNSLNC